VHPTASGRLETDGNLSFSSADGGGEPIGHLSSGESKLCTLQLDFVEFNLPHPPHKKV